MIDKLDIAVTATITASNVQYTVAEYLKAYGWKLIISGGQAHTYKKTWNNMDQAAQELKSVKALLA